MSTATTWSIFDANGIALDGESHSNTCAWFWTMRDGRVARTCVFFDGIGFNQLWRHGDFQYHQYHVAIPVLPLPSR